MTKGNSHVGKSGERSFIRCGSRRWGAARPAAATDRAGEVGHQHHLARSSGGSIPGPRARAGTGRGPDAGGLPDHRSPAGIDQVTPAPAQGTRPGRGTGRGSGRGAGATVAGIQTIQRSGRGPALPSKRPAITPTSAMRHHPD